MLREEVVKLLSLGRFPTENDATDAQLRAIEERLHAICFPSTVDEARAMVSLFNVDDCYGLSWTLLHLIESCGQQVIEREPAPDANEWEVRLWRSWMKGRG